MINRWLKIFKNTGIEWYEDDAPRWAASLAFYALLSIAPLSLLCVAIVGLVFGQDAAKGQLASQMTQAVGPQAAETIQNIISASHNTGSSVLSTLVSFAVLLFGASGVFGELQSSLNQMWGVKPKPNQGVMGFLRARFLSFTMVLGVAFLLLCSLILSAGLSVAGHFFAQNLPGGELLWQAVNFLLPLLVITVLFGLIFKTIPDADLRWKHVGVGAFATALLFSVGKLALGLYLGKSTVASTFGAAGSIVAFVVWIYYVAQILFLGAEFTQVYARELGHPVEPSKHAERI